VIILLIGFSRGNRTLFGLGVVALLGYLSYFYYALQATLLVKSMMLAGSGAFASDGPLPLRTVAPFGSHLLVALDSYSTDKAARIAAALAGFRWQDGSVPTRGSKPQSRVPLHPGAIRFKQARDSKTGQ